MRRLLDIQKRLVPDLSELMVRRYNILRHLMISGTMGRRTLASSLGMTERSLRTESDFLRAQGLLEADAGGMRITAEGSELVTEMEPMIKELSGLDELERRISERFGVAQVVIVPGDSEASPVVKRELGRAGAAVLKKFVRHGDVISVAGGSTMAEVAEALTSSSHFKDHIFVPARGGLGESVEMQANTIASIMAKRTGGRYRLLHVPDQLSDEAYISLMTDPTVREVVEVIRRARIVLHGIGDAMVMARRRKVDQPTRTSLQEEGALAEAFGYYFDRGGSIVHRMQIVGLRIEDLEKAEAVIGVAGGTGKGEAIASVLRFGRDDVLVTDEAAAYEILRHADPT